MFAKPTLNDFLDRIRTELDRIAESAKVDVALIEAQASRTGAHGNAVVQIFATVTKGLDEGIEFALRELKRTIARSTRAAAAYCAALGELRNRGKIDHDDGPPLKGTSGGARKICRRRACQVRPAIGLLPQTVRHWLS
jgi:hypothetical protein